MTPTSDAGLLSVDLGKTNCRVRLLGREGRIELRGPGFAGLAAGDGAESALAAIGTLVDDIAADELGAVRSLGIGAAGADADRGSAERAAVLARERWGWQTVIASDVLTAHVGAFGGAPGTILIAGTGAVAYRIADDGVRRRSDGWGPWLGDEGSGRWIGQAGLIAALRAADGRGPETALRHEAETHFGVLADIPRAIGVGADAPRTLAAFARRVLANGFGKDDAATSIVDAAIRHLLIAVDAVAVPGERVAVLGGLAEHDGFLAALVDGLLDHGLVPRRPSGSALDGAATLAARRDLLHERYAIRV